MSEDLYEQQASHQPSRLNVLAIIASSGKLIAGVVHTWFSDTR